MCSVDFFVAQNAALVIYRTKRERRCCEGYASVNKQIFIIAGPNGAGKTTFAEVFIPAMPSISQFVNADLIAAGLSPFKPELETVQAGKLMLRQIDKLVAQGVSFCLETTLAGRGYTRKIPQWQAHGYEINLIFLRLDSPETAVARVLARVRQGGHHIPEDVIRRRFIAGWKNFESVYQQLVDYWFVYDNTDNTPELLAQG